MRKTKFLKFCTCLLACVMLSGAFAVTASAAGNDSGSFNLNEIGGLTDVLSTVKYADYLIRYNALVEEAVKANGLSASDVINIDVVNDYDPEATSLLNREDYVKNKILTEEVLSQFFDKDKAFFEIGDDSSRETFGIIDILTHLDDYRSEDGQIIIKDTVVTSIKLKEEFYTDDTMRLFYPLEYYENHNYYDNAEAMERGIKHYPTPELTKEEEDKLALFNLIKNFMSNISQKFVSTYVVKDQPDANDDQVLVAASKAEDFAPNTDTTNGLIYLPDHDAVGFTFTVAKTGYYNVSLRYFSVNEEYISKKTSIERSIYIDGAIPYYEATYVGISKTYKNYVERDGSRVYGGEIQTGGGFVTDINKNEIRPTTEMVEAWRTISLMDSTGSFVEPLKFYLTEGTHTLQLYARREPMVVSAITMLPVVSDNGLGSASTIPTYEEYLAKYSGADKVSIDDIRNYAKSRNEKIENSIEEDIRDNKEDSFNVVDFIKLEAEYPEATSDNTIYPTNDRTSCMTSPQHPAIQFLNTLGGSGSGDQKKWSTVGQWVRYKVTVPKTGLYKIAVKFSQTTLQGSFVSRQLRVQLNSELDDPEGARVPFTEAYYLQFNYGDDWQIEYLNNGAPTPFLIYLEEGENIVEFEANLGAMSDIIRRVTASLNDINGAYIKFLMLAGSSPDADRDYGFYRRIPDAVLTLTKQAKELYGIAAEIERLTGTRGSHVATLEKVAQLLERMGSDESEIAGNLDSLKSNLGTLGTWISDSKESPLEIDYLLVAPGDGSDAELPAATPGFFKTLWFEMKMFVASFTTDYNTLGLMKETDESAIVVWTTTGRDQANIIRSMVNNDFTKNTGIAVNLKLVAGGSLLPSVLAGVGPDVSMGHGASDAINWAIRSALVEVTDMGTQSYIDEYNAERGLTGDKAMVYDRQYDAHYITGFNNVVRDFRNEPQDETDKTNASFSCAAVLPLTLHEVITTESYDAMDDAEKKAYVPYDVKYYHEISIADYNKLTEVVQEEYSPVKDGTTTLAYRKYITDKEYAALTSDEQKSFVKDSIRYYEKFSLWGLPQEQSFNMMFYRADIFNELGIKPPETWDDLYAIIGVLQSNNMEIAMPSSLGGFEMFLYQMGGDLYSNGGQTISLDENLSIYAFETMCNFFQSYKFPIAYDFSNRFRSGEIPMGILGYTSYTQLSVFATEIKGMWEFVPLPGWKSASNNASTSGSSAIIMLKGAKDRDVTLNSWKFMVWFTSKSAQSTYASEVTAVLGTESKHPTANKEALKELPWTSAERDSLLAQFDNLVGIPEYPGGYIISRYVNFAFLDVYNNNADPVQAIQEYVVTINAELTRKRQEFDLAYKEVSYSNS